ncbi:hypothetical protein [Yersinia enterocolitica]|uniref:hypothetical protein n=1 Tax=Yersinia enterocolitica TaxID=630 RepID=UPI0025AACEAC|nr:hypothetical protein [Yersinia enterocolitica]MDN0099303.1 hypothetical protein [Yersinia enterocolitica]HDL7101401.1 hypothetical protein [Yersinia enterocolitica]HDM8288124.1 hypothetical protein [Yersinia enterocolitica]
MPGWIAYVDDSGFGKISLRGKKVLCLAGDGELIEIWKKWWTSKVIEIAYPQVEKPDGGKISLYAIDIETNEILFHQNLGCVHLDPANSELQAIFTGSGGTFALAGWQICKCARTSVTQAMQSDCCSGGSVRFVDFASGMVNIEDTVTKISEVNLQLQERGFVMNLNDPSRTAYALSAQDVAQDVANAKAIAASSNDVLSAPTGNEQIVWDQGTKKRLHGFIERLILEEAGR